jgi:hypothetical protein
LERLGASYAITVQQDVEKFSIFYQVLLITMMGIGKGNFEENFQKELLRDKVMCAGRLM